MPSISSPAADILPSPATSIKALARYGFASIGFVYVVLGVLTAMAAIGIRGSNTPNQQEVFQTIQRMPLGQLLLWLVAVGLLGYVAWRFAQTLLDTEQKGTSATGLAFRGFYAFSGLLYALLGIYAARMAWYGHRPPEEHTTDFLLHQAVHHLYGQRLLAFTGLVILAAGLIQLYRAWSGKFDTDINPSPFTSAQCRLVYHMGQVGFSARGLVLCLMGYYCFLAAHHANASEIKDTEGCFQVLQDMGPGVLDIVALGLVAYGIYMLIQARFPILRGL
ncbi:DUF1206 domain-containing protein [Hymenobacter sp. BT730]|uniref:DUF1206 domain-containing protein n=1 Tax=Hymenobacter sp. BT730 TaxID=3063332 RepID=UPI0026E07B3C|nr:DUF1206 domain-containing protein [Hymenobacter sp. BT730]